MFNLFRRRSSSGPIPSLDSVRFDTTGFEAQGEPRPRKVRVWSTPDGDGLGLYFFPLPPDIPSAETVEALHAFYARGAQQAQGRLVELSLLTLDSCPAVRTILKAPQQPSGMIYIGSLTIPFRDFSFVIKVQCEERGITGMREAVLLDRRLAEGDIDVPDDGPLQIPDWNPDDARFDHEFPDHPITRVRQVLSHVEGSVVVADEICGLPAFPLPRAST